MWKDSHYAWLEANLQSFFDALQLDRNRVGDVRYYNSAYGDHCYQYRHKWEDHGIPFPHGVAIYYLSFIAPYKDEVRETVTGWIVPQDWVIANYERFKPHLKPIKE